MIWTHEQWRRNEQLTSLEILSRWGNQPFPSSIQSSSVHSLLLGVGCMNLNNVWKQSWLYVFLQNDFLWTILVILSITTKIYDYFFRLKRPFFGFSFSSLAGNVCDLVGMAWTAAAWFSRLIHMLSSPWTHIINTSLVRGFSLMFKILNTKMSFYLARAFYTEFLCHS